MWRTGIALGLATIVAGPALADARLDCEEAEGIAETLRAEMPMQLDEETQLVSVEVDCDARATTYTRRLVAGATLPPDWREVMARLHRFTHCATGGMVRVGDWGIIEVAVDRAGNELARYGTMPSECPR